MHQSDLSLKLFSITLLGNIFTYFTQMNVGTIFTVLAAISTIIYNVIKTRKELKNKQ